ncbi:ATP-binding protein [Ramlibacter sp.]|uniref:ATP-binding protein n=1 Tax=Ramlibacter sp. TaxID=1917967 RepID=UPI002C54FAB7|nr:transporter substrate-binding domain-containing protein [Ramlibacter sp.]HWI80522.1 transporter substrate-binding domain-containing protein [Ramlibacter sp.]
MQPGSRRPLRALVPLVLLLFQLLWPAAAAQKVRVGIYQNPPKLGYSAAGQPQGIFVDVIAAVAAREGWTIEYVPGTFAEGLARLRSGEIDLMPDVARTAARERLFDFAQEPVLHSWSQVYARPGSGIRTILDLSNKRVAVLEGSVQQDFFLQMASSFGVRAVLESWPDYDSALRAVAEQRADAVVTNNFHGRVSAPAAGLVDTAIIFAPASLFFAGRHGVDPALLQAIDRTLRALKADPRSAYYQSLERWTSAARAPSLPPWFKWAALAALVLLAVCVAWALTLRQAAARLRDSERRQRQLAEGLARIFDRSLDVICVLDADLNFVRVSQASRTLWGYQPEELRGRSCLEVVPPTDHQVTVGALMRIMGGMPAQSLPARAIRKDGSMRHVLWSAVWSEAQGEMYCVARDDTERRQLITSLKTRTAELQRANEDLQAFGQSVSHDLRAPLAAIAGFVGKVARDNRERLPAPSMALLDRVLAAARRMEQLIEDLLRLARLAEQGVHRRPCDLSALAADIGDGLRQAKSPSQVRLSIDPGMEVEADPRLLRIALENLMENAWKFTSRTADAAVAVGRERLGGEEVFYVRDNGAGFAMEHAARLFTPFQRLHGRDEFDGTGIGLSIVHRIVTRHGGRIWADAAPGQGATFRFTLA